MSEKVINTAPVRYADGVYHIGTPHYPSWLIDCGEELVLLDTAMPNNLELLLSNIKTLGYDVKRIKHIIHSHAHIDHMGCTKALVALSGAKTYVGLGDEDSAAGRNELQWTNEFGMEYTGAFEPDVVVCDGDVIKIGNRTFRFVATPGHTAGVMSIFFDATDSGKTYRAGMFGGAGLNSMKKEYLQKYSLPLSLRDDFKNSIKKMYNERVEIHLGNHLENAKHSAKVAKIGEGKNPFIESESWKQLLDQKLKEIENLLTKEKNMDIKRITALVEERKEELFELLSSLIKINSENFMTSGNEKALAEHVNKLCLELGLESEVYSPMDLEGFENHPDYVPGRSLENRPNVTARWRGAEDVDELMIMGHLDTVPIGDVANWNKDPLSGEISDGKIWGRGACDDKYAFATALFIIKLLKEEGFKPKKNLLFSAYCDEEYGGSHGALASALRFPAKRVVNMDGRQEQIWNCASGGQEAKYFFHTKDTVDSAGVVATGIPTVLEVMKSFAKKREDELEANPYYHGTRIPKTSLRYMGIKAGNAGMDLGRGEILFTYYTDKTKEEIYAEFAELEKVMAEKLLPLGIIGDKFVPHTRFFHYTHCKPDADAILDFSDAMFEALGKRPEVCGSCLSDLSVIGKYGGECAFAYGGGRDFSLPGGAHQPNEFIECEKLVEFVKTIAAYVVKVLG